MARFSTGSNGNGNGKPHSNNGNGHANGKALRSSNGNRGKRILVTGGAGFIGSHLADELLRHGYRVRALDVLAEQVHGPERQRPEYLSDDVELIVGDVR